MIPSSRSTMVLYLLFPAVILGIVETGNVTDAFSKLEGTQTSNVSTNVNGVIKQGNVTSILHIDELMKHKGDLGFPSNQTFNVTSEDHEKFQDLELILPNKYCDEGLLVQHSNSCCGAEFHMAMMAISPELWCNLDYIIKPYNNMSKCMERLTDLVGCYFPNPNVQDFFVEIHSTYFQNCSEEKLLLSDAPHGVVVVLTLIPVSLIPVLVFLVVWKSKIRE
ncbi:receptor activity-modifying protein 1-like isoform X2 [Lampris incognitus]|uniref:receptor activity-modifying protein 1-like isoform X2 n=1 Tax=Lampris incognitus TaxID=2546036 RepID=UPI0024B52D50|nr:receptor activity-modifying protein 1-like isoform X2 [Lampris incognitus]